MMRLIYLLLQYDQNNAQKYDQSDVQCQRSFYDVTIVRPITTYAFLKGKYLRKIFGPVNIDNIWRIRNNMENGPSKTN
jgi:hypothetical protein